MQENNVDTVVALAQRTFGGAYQLVPPMSVTLGMREILAARRIRLFSDTGAWKQTALRVGLFSPVTAEYPITLLQDHPDALLTATVETATHPISLHPEWDLGLSMKRRYDVVVGTGGIGSGIFLALEGNRTLGREESRPAELLDQRDYCKLHIVCHYVQRLLGPRGAGRADRQGGSGRRRAVQSWGRCRLPGSTRHW